jgi:hypothetical protein
VADTKLTSLTAATSVANADLLYIAQSGSSLKATRALVLTANTGESISLVGNSSSSISIASDGSLTLTPASAKNTTIASGGLVFGSTSGIFNDAANILVQRNGVNAQTLKVYNTFTDVSNGEWGAVRWNSSVLEIGAYANGTGSSRNLALVAANSVTATMSANTTASFILTNSLAGSAAQVQIKAVNDLGHLAYQGVTSSTFSSAGALATDTAFWLSFGCPALYGSQSAQPVIWCQSLTEIARIDTGGQWQIALKTKAGTPSDADFSTPASGMIAVDTTASKIWVRVGSTWKSVAVA